MLLLQLLTGSTTLDILPTPQPRRACSILGQTDCGDGLGSSWNSGWWFSSSGLSISANPSSCPALMSCPKAETALLTSQLAWKAWGAIIHMLSVLTVPWSFNERCSQFLGFGGFFFSSWCRTLLSPMRLPHTVVQTDLVPHQDTPCMSWSKQMASCIVERNTTYVVRPFQVLCFPFAFRMTIKPPSLWHGTVVQK